MAVPGFLKTIVTAPYYRRHRLDAIREFGAAFHFRRHRLYQPQAFLAHLGITEEEAFAGYEGWRPLLEAAVLAVDDAGNGRQGGCSMEDGMILYGLARALRPQVVIETGVAAGVSTSFLGAAMVENGTGRLYSLELPPVQTHNWAQDDGAVFDWPEKGVGWVIPDAIRRGLENRHILLLEDVRTALPRLLAECQSVDLYFHDDLHTPDHMRWQYELVWPHISPGGVLASDDANVGWIDFCSNLNLRSSRFTNVQRLTAVRRPLETRTLPLAM
jgi:predicted O-methyltransferase YrrM